MKIDPRFSDGSEWDQDLAAFKREARVRGVPREHKGPVKVPNGPRWRMPGVVYAYRTRKSHAVLGLPFFGWHWGYVGQTRNERARDGEHLSGGGRYGKGAAPWSDLKPQRYVLFRMAHCPQWILNLMERIFVYLLWPVYNDKMNRWNPRRISRARARFHRSVRDRTGWALALHGGHGLMALLTLLILAGAWTR
jgi:hypothetical protein